MEVSAKIGKPAGPSPAPGGQTIDIQGSGPTVRRMGDKSPKANRKHATQKGDRDNATAKKKNAAIAAKQTPKK